MGNKLSKTKYIEAILETTKTDISQSYDLTTIEGINKANAELIDCFISFNEQDREYVNNNLFRPLTI